MNLPWGPGIEWVDPEMSLGKPLPRLPRRGHLNTIFMLFFPSVCAVLSYSVRPFPSTTPPHQAPLSMGILQARILEWVAMPSSTGSSQPGIEPSLPHCRWILYHLSHQGSPWILVWAAYPFSRLSSWSRNWSGVSCTAGGFLLPTELPGKAQLLPLLQELFFFFSPSVARKRGKFWFGACCGTRGS